MRRLTGAVTGGALGYFLYFLVVVGEILLKDARLHYFDKELLRVLAILPVGGLSLLFTGDWRNPLVWGHALLAYVLVVLGATLAWHWMRARSGDRQA